MEADTWRRGTRRDMATAWRGRVTEGLAVSFIAGRQRSHVPSCRDWGRGKLGGEVTPSLLESPGGYGREPTTLRKAPNSHPGSFEAV